MVDTDAGNRSSGRLAIFVLCFGLVGTAAMLYYHQGLLVPRARETLAANHLDGGYSFGNDFYQIWLTSHEWLDRRSDPYTSEMTREIQIGLYGRELDPNLPGDPKDRRSFPYPAFTDLLLWPMARLPFPVARIVVVCALGLATAASVWCWLQALGCRLRWPGLAIVYLMVFSSFPVLEGLYAGQIGLLVGFLLSASILALQRGRLLLSGILMALTTIKPQVTVLAILYLLIWSSYDLRRRARFCAGLFFTGFLLVGGALLVWPHWIQSWTNLLAAYHDYNPLPLLWVLFSSLVGRHAAERVSAVLIVGLLIGATLLAWRSRKVESDSPDFWLTLTLLLGLTTIAILPGQAVYDHVILLPGILLLALRWRDLSPSWILKALLTIEAATLLWPWFASIAMIVLRPLLTHRQFYSRAVFLLPLCMAYGFPFVVLGPIVVALRRERGSAGRAALPLSS